MSKWFDIDKVYMHLAWMLPRRLVYWCAIRLGVHGTVGEHSKQIVPELKFIDALQRWDPKP